MLLEQQETSPTNRSTAVTIGIRFSIQQIHIDQTYYNILFYFKTFLIYVCFKIKAYIVCFSINNTKLCYVCDSSLDLGNKHSDMRILCIQIYFFRKFSIYYRFKFYDIVHCERISVNCLWTTTEWCEYVCMLRLLFQLIHTLAILFDRIPSWERGMGRR